MGSRAYTAIGTNGSLLEITTSLDLMLSRLNSALGGLDKFFLDANRTLMLNTKNFRKIVRDRERAHVESNEQARKAKRLAHYETFNLPIRDLSYGMHASIPVYMEGRKNPVFFVRDDWAD